MISIEYDLIKQWLKTRGITLRKMCEDTGIPEGTIYSSFKRGSKMQVAYVWRIADYMGVNPVELLKHDENGNVDYEDWERVSFGRTSYEEMIENQSINDLVWVLKQLNPAGLGMADQMLCLLLEIPRFNKSANEEGRGSQDHREENGKEE